MDTDRDLTGCPVLGLYQALNMDTNRDVTGCPVLGLYQALNMDTNRDVTGCHVLGLYHALLAAMVGPLTCSKTSTTKNMNC